MTIERNEYVSCLAEGEHDHWDVLESSYHEAKYLEEGVDYVPVTRRQVRRKVLVIRSPQTRNSARIPGGPLRGTHLWREQLLGHRPRGAPAPETAGGVCQHHGVRYSELHAPGSNARADLGRAWSLLAGQHFA